MADAQDLDLLEKGDEVFQQKFEQAGMSKDSKSSPHFKEESEGERALIKDVDSFK